MDASITTGLKIAAPAELHPASPGRHGLRRFLILDSPYIVMLAMVLLGIGYRAFSGQPMTRYGEFLMPVFGGLCMAGGLRHVRGRREGIDLIWTQILHGGACLITIYVLKVQAVQGSLTDNSLALLQLVMLALAVFLAAVHAHSWRIGSVGVVLGFSVPAVAWVDRSAVFIGMVATAAVLVVLALWLLHWRAGRQAVSPLTERGQQTDPQRFAAGAGANRLRSLADQRRCATGWPASASRSGPMVCPTRHSI